MTKQKMVWPKSSYRGPFHGHEGDDYIVGYQYGPDLGLGPVARISADNDWVHVVTSEYEGHAMLKIECLPMLIKALSDIRRERRERKRIAPFRETNHA